MGTDTFFEAHRAAVHVALLSDTVSGLIPPRGGEIAPVPLSRHQ
jgi:hypothetical protein